MFVSCLICLPLFSFEIGCLLRVFAWTSKCLVLAYGCPRTSRLVSNSRVSVSPTTVHVSFCPPSGRNPSCGVEPPRGGNPFNGASEWGKSHQKNCESGTLSGEKSLNQISIFSVEKIPQRSVLNGCRGTCVVASEWGKSHLETYKLSIENK